MTGCNNLERRQLVTNWTGLGDNTVYLLINGLKEVFTLKSVNIWASNPIPRHPSFLVLHLYQYPEFISKHLFQYPDTWTSIRTPGPPVIWSNQLRAHGPICLHMKLHHIVCEANLATYCGADESLAELKVKFCRLISLFSLHSKILPGLHYGTVYFFFYSKPYMNVVQVKLTKRVCVNTQHHSIII